MRLHSKFAMIALVFVPVVVFLAYNSLSASIPEREPFAEFERECVGDPATFIPAPVMPGPKKAWAEAVRNVLDQVELLESKLELYAAQLEEIESRRVAEEVAGRLELESSNPGKALEDVLNRFSGMVDAYAVLDEKSKEDLVAMSEADRVDALSRAAVAQAGFDAYLDRLAEIRARKVAMDREAELAAFEVSMTALLAARSATEAVAAEACVHAIARSAEKAGKEAVEKATDSFMIGKAVQGAGIDAVRVIEASPENAPHTPTK